MRKSTKFYCLNDIDGLVKQSISRATKTKVSVYHTKQALIPSDKPWVTICERHGFSKGWETLPHAIQNSADPSDWCPSCTKVEPRTETPIRIAVKALEDKTPYTCFYCGDIVEDERCKCKKSLAWRRSAV